MDYGYNKNSCKINNGKVSTILQEHLIFTIEYEGNTKLYLNQLFVSGCKLSSKSSTVII